jgi:hypothetical protein
MRKMFVILCLVILMSTPVLAFAADVGLQVNGGAGFAFKPGGSAQWFDGAPPYFEQRYNQTSYSLLTGQTKGNWGGTWSDTQGNYATYSGIAESKAKANFGSLGVYSYAWVSEKDASTNHPGNYWDWQTSASANASFSDVWRVDVIGVTPGTVGTLSVDVDLSGSRTANWQNHNSSASLSLYDYTTASRAQYIEDIDAGHYVLNISFIYGQDNAIMMDLTSGNSSFNEFFGGGVASYVDFYNTANITGLTFRDSSGNELTDYTLTTGSGHDYDAVPIPAAFWLLGSGLIGLIGIRRKLSK